jgi:protein-S-isoprenylcysteine O-methyltransferase Ste14
MIEATVNKISSLVTFGVAVIGLAFLIFTKHLFSSHPIGIMIQVLSAGLMIWARITFGIRSFHSVANTTKGKLVTSGPYHLLRHPIYVSVIYFVWAGVLSTPVIATIAAAAIITISLIIRMLLEEKFLKLDYDEYIAYSKHTYLIIPFLF